MKVIRLLFFIPPILCTAQAGAQEIISNMPTINSESTETVIQREPTQAEKEAAEAATIKYGRNGEREIPSYMALRSFANSALQAFANPARRESWYAAYDLDEGKEETLKAILNKFLSSYTEVQNAQKAQSCNVYYEGKAQGREVAAEEDAYELLREDLGDAEQLYVSTIADIRAEVSDSMAMVFEGAVKQQIETSTKVFMDYQGFNARHDIPSEEFFSKLCQEQ